MQITNQESSLALSIKCHLYDDVQTSSYFYRRIAVFLLKICLTARDRVVLLLWHWGWSWGGGWVDKCQFALVIPFCHSPQSFSEWYRGRGQTLVAREGIHFEPINVTAWWPEQRSLDFCFIYKQFWKWYHFVWIAAKKVNRKSVLSFLTLSTSLAYWSWNMTPS